MKNQIIKHKKPVLLPNFRCYIKLNKDEVDISNIKTKATKEGYREQTERHITIIGRTGSQVIRKLLNKLAPKEKSQTVKKIKKIINKLDWQFTPKEIYHVSRRDHLSKNDEDDNRESYVRIVNMPAARKFKKELRTLFNAEIPTHCFPHITLFTRGEEPNPKYCGIPIRSKEIFDRLHPKKITKRSSK